MPQVSGACLPRFELDGYRALDVPSLHRATLDAIARLDTPVDHLDLRVAFAGTPPAFPAPLLLSRWTPAHFEHYEGAIRRESRRSRAVDVPADLAGADLYMFHIAGKLVRLDASHRFTPCGQRHLLGDRVPGRCVLRCSRRRASGR